jgi:hypothetical protein
MENRIKIGVRACLLGQPVRFDGSHTHDRYLTGIVGKCHQPDLQQQPCLNPHSVALKVRSHA